MRKVVLFTTKENFEVDEQINNFVEKNDVIIVDVKYNTFLDTTHDIIMTSALLIYEEKTTQNMWKQTWCGVGRKMGRFRLKEKRF